MHSRWWVVCGPLTGDVTVDIDTGRIVDCAPVFGRFRQQPFGNIRRWAEKKGWQYEEELAE